jgi:hypothetical protein
LVSPVTTIGESVFDADACEGEFTPLHVAVKLVVGLPLLACGVNVTVIRAFPRATVGFDGGSGTVAGTRIGGDPADDAPVPFPFVALTVQV